jgi:hypothetical protein
MIGHPPCTYLSNSSSKHLYIDGHKENGRVLKRWQDMAEGAAFFAFLWGQSQIPRICLENPIMLGYAKALTGAGKQTQTIQPYQHGHGEQKATCLWLKNLPLLVPSNEVSGREQKCHKQAPSPTRWKERSRTYPGIALAFAEQWG